MTQNTPENAGPDITRVPVLPLRDVVVYPHMAVPLFIGRDKSLEALDSAMGSDQRILLVAQRNGEVEEPDSGDLFSFGTLSRIQHLVKLPDATVKLVIAGATRCQVVRYDVSGHHFVADVVTLSDERVPGAQEFEVLKRAVIHAFDRYAKYDQRDLTDVLGPLAGIDEPSRLADTVAAYLNIKLDDKQAILETLDVAARLEKLLSLMESEVELQEMEKRIRGRVKEQMGRNQRQYLLNEQMKAIREELGDLDGGPDEFEELAKKIAKAGMPKAARVKAETELNKLKLMSPMSAEATVARNYIDWLVKVPWKRRSRVGLDLRQAEDLLNAEHYGLDKVKERILEFLAVQRRVRSIRGPILCLVGPPGVGKTSLGQSIARATHRKYLRMALGGVRDEAEIRGHRRTYVGAMPGKILQSLCKVNTRNPMFMLDEIDKMAVDFRGDPASALLEVLDPAQNHTFSDHYLELDFDLSEVMFVATANSLNIPPALLDRMEIIRISGYTEDEKINIALRYLIPKQIKQNGLGEGEIQITEVAVREIIRYYTREAGVRGLERELATICRKVVRNLLLKPSTKKVLVNHRNLEHYLGVQRFRYGRAEESDRIGQVTGLAWTEVGGELLTIEAATMPGTGKQTYTGKLGEVMQESIHTAVTVARTRAAALGICPTFYQKEDVHIHVPEGATPKDGPSAGIGMCTALVSALTGIPARADLAMTGEITLRGEVLPIGGLKEKLLAAHRGGIETVLIPTENQKDLADVPRNIKQGLNILPVRWIDEVFDVALRRRPQPLDVPLPVEPDNVAGRAPMFGAH